MIYAVWRSPPDKKVFASIKPAGLGFLIAKQSKDHSCGQLAQVPAKDAGALMNAVLPSHRPSPTLAFNRLKIEEN